MKVSKRQSMMRFAMLLLFIGCILVLVFWLYPRNSAKTPQTETEEGQRSEAAARGEKRRGQIVGYTPLARFSSDPTRQGYLSYLKAQVLSKADQRPVSGATVTFFRSRDPRTRRFDDAVIRLLTDSGGFFQLTHRAALEGWLVIEKPGFAAIEEQKRGGRRRRPRLLRKAT